MRLKEQKVDLVVGGPPCQGFLSLEKDVLLIQRIIKLVKIKEII
jgi:site-specific DNA-cytosine methylase